MAVGSDTDSAEASCMTAVGDGVLGVDIYDGGRGRRRGRGARVKEGDGLDAGNERWTWGEGGRFGELDQFGADLGCAPHINPTWRMGPGVPISAPHMG